MRELLDDAAYDAASRTTINAHYTDPAYVAEVWAALDRLGFDGGTVLEPGSGAGTFIGMAPASAQMVGVELDGTTAAIARGLYPNADIRTESFAETRMPRGHFDAVVGNVPFESVALHDPLHNAGGHSMHNHFIIKSLALTRPGGVVAVLTSSFTMDATNPSARREMNGMADLVGAVRLPSGAHRRAAGTEALTDLLIFRRREPGIPPRDVAWETVTAQQVDGKVIKTNTYFNIHPDHVLGELHVGQGMYGGETVSVRADDLAATPERLHGALRDITSRAIERGDVFTKASAAAVQERAAAAAAQTSLWDGTIVAAGAEFKIAHGGMLRDFAVPKTQAVELRALLSLRDGSRALLDAEARSLDDTRELDTQRAALLAEYRGYVAKFGPINRFTTRGTGRFEPVLDEMTGEVVIDPQTGQPARGEERLARITPRAIATFKQDPQSALVRALERFDETEQTSAPASLLLQRVVVPRPAKQGAETPAEAIALSLDETGRVDLEVVAHLLGVDAEEARAQLGTLVYEDPTSGELVHAPEYLSGEVRTKLDAAAAAAETDARFTVNVEALQAVIPDPIGIEQIEARLGSVWISPEIHEQFLRELLNDRSIRVENPMPGAWEVRGYRAGVLATDEWGTMRRPAADIAQAVMEQRRIEVHDEVETSEGKKRKVLNPVETTAAQEKADALQTRFSEWVWEDPARAAELSDVYNRRFNSIVLRDYSQAGDYLTLPGLAATFTLRPHQRAAVARMIAEPAVGLFHQVGAGKTLEMIVGATEMRRMGLINKPAIVVPNHMLEQFSREWLQAYPQARILAASTNELTGDKRRLFVARAAANDWDGIVLTQSAFKKIGISPDFQAEYINGQISEMRAALVEAKEADAMSVKRIEKRILSLEERQKKMLAIERDHGVSFEDMGIDYLVVDEAHMYKNLATASNIQDAGIEGSQQASDLHMKLEYLRGRHGDRVATMATATPLANSVTEAYVMQRYLRPDLLEAAGVTSFDGWAATFGSQVTEMEMGPAGGFRLKTRFARFQNVPEMLRMWHTFADVKTGEDLKLPVPLIRERPSDGKREIETIVLDPTPELEEYIGQIADRAEAVQNRTVTADEDNMLWIAGDGRKAALDLRLIDQFSEQSGVVKLDAVATQIVQEWERTRNNEYRDEVSGQTSPIRGGMQMVFSDLGTPNDKRWDAYHELKAKLVEAGMPSDSIRFIHEAKDDKAKGRLFAAARAGHVSVLIGSTGKMGVGTNVQARITALHHIDCPWRPADLEQRDGRGIRQGNQNAEVGIYRYVVERSFDAYSWQTVGRKAKFIAQIMRGRLDTREIEDIGDTALSAAEAKALASGNPLVLDKANADSEFQKLRRQETAHHRAQAALRHRAQNARESIGVHEHMLTALRIAAGRTVDVSGDAFRMVVDGRSYDSRQDAATAIAAWAERSELAIIRANSEHPLTLGTIAGHTITVRAERVTVEWKTDVRAHLALEGVPYSGGNVRFDELGAGTIGLVRTLENKTTAIARNISESETRIARSVGEAEEAEARLGKAFPHAEALKAAQQRVADVDAALAASNKPTDEVPSEPAPAQRSLLSASFPSGPTTAGVSTPTTRNTHAPSKPYERAEIER
ncbi:SNF2-related protein [Agromyces neolithicus]|uniref:Helicase ATP-binding domain-containing protein n=1 Tax=Agromyces neolithicus TaxID=269420 RepID=A0ABN2MDR5_9MICO